MIFNKIFIFFILFYILCSCNTSTSFTGTYSNELGDKLKVRKNKTYKLSERINNKIRKTQGTWEYWTNDGSNKLVRFFNNPPYIIDNFHTLSLEKSNTINSSVRILYADTDSIIKIPAAYGFIKNDTISLTGLHQSYFEKLTFSENLDSLHLCMWKYKDVTIKIPETIKYNYTVRFYPTDSIYQFDRIYNNIDHKLFPIDSTNKNKRLRFKKNGV